MGAEQIWEMMKSLEAADSSLEKRFGLDESGLGQKFVFRNMVAADAASNVFRLSGSAVPEGSVMRLHVIDPKFAEAQMASQLQVSSLQPISPVLNSEPEQQRTPSSFHLLFHLVTVMAFYGYSCGSVKAVFLLAFICDSLTWKF